MNLFIKRWWWVIAYLVIYVVATAIIGIVRYHQYEIFYFDHGIFDQALWKASRFQAPLIDHNEPKPLNQLGDHFTLLMYVLIPLYWLPYSEISIFFIQPLMVAVAVGVLLKVAWRKSRNPWWVAAVMVASTFFIGMQNALLGEFHGDLMILIPLACMLDALDRKKWRHYFFWTFLVLLAKESNSIIILSIAGYLILKKQWKVAVTTTIIALAYTFIITNIIMPWLAGRPYEYTNYIPPINGLVNRFFLPVIKTQTMLVSLLSFGFLPLLSPAFLPVILQDWLVRFALNDVPTRHNLGMHYNAATAILLAYGAVLGYQHLPRWRIKRQVIPLTIILIGIIIHRFWYRGPLGLAVNPAFYAHTNDFSFMSPLLASTPNQGVVMTPNNLAVHLIRSREVMLYRSDYEKYVPHTIIFDLREGQGINNFWPMSETETRALFTRVKQDSRYRLTQTGTDQYVFTLK